jgi:hypothetical protein
VPSSRTAARATLDLNSAVCCLRTLVVNHPWPMAGVGVGDSLSHLSNFRGPAHHNLRCYRYKKADRS